jgi:hypothetical protein
MTDLEKYELVNKAESIKELEDAILAFADDYGEIQGRTRSFNAAKMSSYVESVVKGSWANVLTREFGIRQQALYLREYKMF